MLKISGDKLLRKYLITRRYEIDERLACREGGNIFGSSTSIEMSKKGKRGAEHKQQARPTMLMANTLQGHNSTKSLVRLKQKKSMASRVSIEQVKVLPKQQTLVVDSFSPADVALQERALANYECHQSEQIALAQLIESRVQRKKSDMIFRRSKSVLIAPQGQQLLWAQKLRSHSPIEVLDYRSKLYSNLTAKRTISRAAIKRNGPLQIFGEAGFLLVGKSKAVA